MVNNLNDNTIKRQNQNYKITLGWNEANKRLVVMINDGWVGDINLDVKN